MEALGTLGIHTQSYLHNTLHNNFIDRLFGLVVTISLRSVGSKFAGFATTILYKSIAITIELTALLCYSRGYDNQFLCY